MVLEVTQSTAKMPAASLERIVSLEDASTPIAERNLHLLFLGCEANPPYGPYEHTATLFLDLISRSLKEIGAPAYKVILDIYHVSKEQFPPRSAYEDYDGIILPGSFSAAYDTDPWILELSQVIQDELVAKQRPTLGVCFGHQLYAHSFPDGGAIKCPAGSQAGRKVSELTPHGQRWLRGLSNDSAAASAEGSSSTVPATSEVVNGLELFYSHGDMVEQLPPQGFSLGGTEAVPYQAAVYFSASDNIEQRKPIAITFQAHPEYASSQTFGLHGTLIPILQAMRDRNDISSDEWKRAEVDAIQQYEQVERQSIQTMITAGRLLGWFPAE